MSGKEKVKVEIIYFYSDLYESRRSLLPIIRRLQKKRKDIHIHLINIEEPENSELAELYNVNSVPLIIFLTPKGEVATRKSMPLSDESIINEIANQIIRGDLPKPHVNELKRKILDSFKSVSRRNELTQLIVEQIESDILEADSEAEIYDTINLHISAINHTISDLEEYKTILQKYMRKKQDFII
ncbi:MAG: thioredoxin family protein [Candidatus Bathyarchaeia archaeon]